MSPWLDLCRAAVAAVKTVLAEMPTREERERPVGRGKGGDVTAAIDEAAERAGLLVQQAELNEAGARHEEAVARVEEARAAYEALGDGTRALQAAALLGRIEMKRGRMREAAVLLEESLARLDPAEDPGLFARLAAEYARIHMLADQVAEGAAWAERALEAAGPARLIEVIAEAMDTRGVCLQGLDRLDEGIALILASVELAAAHRPSNAELRARFDLGGRLVVEWPRAAIYIISAGVDGAQRAWPRTRARRLARVPPPGGGTPRGPQGPHHPRGRGGGPSPRRAALRTKSVCRTPPPGRSARLQATEPGHLAKGDCSDRRGDQVNSHFRAQR